MEIGPVADIDLLAQSTVAIVGDNVQLWDVATMEQNALTDLKAECVAGSQSGKMLAVATGRDIHVWDVANGKKKYTLGHGQFVSSIAFSPDGSRLMSGGDGGTMIIWDIESGRRV